MPSYSIEFIKLAHPKTKSNEDSDDSIVPSQLQLKRRNQRTRALVDGGSDYFSGHSTNQTRYQSRCAMIHGRIGKLLHALDIEALEQFKLEFPQVNEVEQRQPQARYGGLDLNQFVAALIRVLDKRRIIVEDVNMPKPCSIEEIIDLAYEIFQLIQQRIVDRAMDTNMITFEDFIGFVMLRGMNEMSIGDSSNQFAYIQQQKYQQQIDWSNEKFQLNVRIDQSLDEWCETSLQSSLKTLEFAEELGLILLHEQGRPYVYTFDLSTKKCFITLPIRSRIISKLVYIPFAASHRTNGLLVVQSTCIYFYVHIPRPQSASSSSKLSFTLMERFFIEDQPICVEWVPSLRKLYCGCLNGFVNEFTLNSTHKPTNDGDDDGRIPLRFLAHEDMITSIRIVPSFDTIITASMDGFMRTWSIRTHLLINELHGAHSLGIVAMHYISNCQTIISVSSDQFMCSWSIHLNKPLKRVRASNDIIAHSCIVVHDHVLMTMDTCGHSHLWDVHTLTCISSLTLRSPHPFTPNQLIACYSPRNHRNVFVVASFPMKRRLLHIDATLANVSHVVLNDDGDDSRDEALHARKNDVLVGYAYVARQFELVIGYGNGVARCQLIDGTYATLPWCDLHNDSMQWTCLLVDPVMSRIYLGASNGEIIVKSTIMHTLHDIEDRLKFSAHDNDIQWMKLIRSAKRHVLVSASLDGVVRVHSLRRQLNQDAFQSYVEWKTPHHDAAPTKYAINESGDLIVAVTTASGILDAFDVHTQSALRSFDFPESMYECMSVEFINDTLIVIGSNAGDIMCILLRRCPPKCLHLATIQVSESTSLSCTLFENSTSSLYVGMDGGRIAIFNMTTLIDVSNRFAQMSDASVRMLKDSSTLLSMVTTTPFIAQLMKHDVVHVGALDAFGSMEWIPDIKPSGALAIRAVNGRSIQIIDACSGQKLGSVERRRRNCSANEGKWTVEIDLDKKVNQHRIRLAGLVAFVRRNLRDEVTHSCDAT